jgi:TatD DNase family protein
MYQDAHIHLQDILNKEHRVHILRSAYESTIKRFFCNATSPNDWAVVNEYAQCEKNIIPFFGVHPWFVDSLPKNWVEQLNQYLNEKPCGIGEIGLDRLKGKLNFEKQQQVFIQQLELALQRKKVFSVHCVRAWGSLLDIFRSYRETLEKVPFMIHAFSGTKEVISELISLGAYISFTPGLVMGAPQKVREAFQEVPLERLLLETDFPAMPQYTGKEREHSVCLRMLYRIASELKGLNEEKLQQSVWDNGTVFTN